MNLRNLPACPFCGSSTILPRFKPHDNGTVDIALQCQGCLCVVSTTCLKDDLEQGEADCIAKWTQRTTPEEHAEAERKRRIRNRESRAKRLRTGEAAKRRRKIREANRGA